MTREIDVGLSGLEVAGGGIAHALFDQRDYCALQADIPACDRDRFEARYYVRVTVSDRRGALAGIAQAPGDHGVSIATMRQDESDVDARTAGLVTMNHHACGGATHEARLAIERLSVVSRVDSFRAWRARHGG